MSLCTIGTRSVATVEPTASVESVACLMNKRSVGSIVVVRDEVAVGIITDRDIVIRVLCAGRDAKTTTAEDVMSAPLTTIGEDREALKAATTMREAQVRRLPVVDPEGKLLGIVCLDDLAFHLSRCYHEMAEAISSFPVQYEGG